MAFKEPSFIGKTAVVTGAASGLGRAEAVALAKRGANVVITDLSDMSETVAEIEKSGGEAYPINGDIGDWNIGQTLVDSALQQFGSLDIVVNNAGITRDAMIFNMAESQWDEVLRTHLKGHASLSRAASAFWREESKKTGSAVNARIINTASEAAITGSAGQPNYAAAKAGIVSLTTSTARAVQKYGVTVNAISPRARTGMTAGVFPEAPVGDDALDPAHVGRLVVFLASDAARDITGRNFIVYGRMVALVAEPKIERVFQANSSAFTLEELSDHLSSVEFPPINQSLMQQLQELTTLSQH